MKNWRVLISGAGIAGPSLVQWLLRYGFEPTLIEPAPAFREGGYMIDVWGTGHDIVERYGLREAAQRRGYIFDRLKFVDKRGKEVSGLAERCFAGLLAESSSAYSAVIWRARSTTRSMVGRRHSMAHIFAPFTKTRTVLTSSSPPERSAASIS